MKISKKKVALGLFIAGVVAFTIFGTETIPQYQTVQLGNHNIKKELEFTTSWYPVSYAKISLGASQDIVNIAVKEGQGVKRDQVIAQLVDTQEYNQYKTAWSNYNAAVYNKKNAEASPLATTNSIKAAQQQVNSAYYQMKNAENTLNKKKIKTPISGKVIAVIRNDFTTSSSSLSSSALLGGSSLGATDSGNYIVIADTVNPTFLAKVSERDIVGISNDMPVMVTSRVSDTILSGKVVYVSKVPVANEEEPQYEIQVKMNEYPATLPYGAKIEGKIVLAEKKEVPSLQYDAITIDSSVKGSILILKDNKVESREVSIGLVGDDMIEVLEGIGSDDKVIVDQLRDKKIISIRPWLKNLFGKK